MNRNIAPAAALLILLTTGGCSDQEAAHDADPHALDRLDGIIGRRILTCNDGSQVDVDVLDDGLRMAITTLPQRHTHVVRASRTGASFRGKNISVDVAGGTIAITQAGHGIRICRRAE